MILEEKRQFLRNVQDLVPACIELLVLPTNVITQYEIGVWDLCRNVERWPCSFCRNDRHPLSGGEINSVSTERGRGNWGISGTPPSNLRLI